MRHNLKGSKILVSHNLSKMLIKIIIKYDMKVLEQEISRLMLTKDMSCTRKCLAISKILKL